MLLREFFVTLGVAVITQASLQPPRSLGYVGVGYNLLEANPEGGDLSTGGIDPGLRPNRKYFNLTYQNNKISTDLKYLIPDQLSYEPHTSCLTLESNEVVTGTKSYQNELKVDVKAEGKDNYNGCS